MMTNILSPHYDDAVLSCWAQLDQPATRVVTVFGGAPSTTKKGLWDKVTTQSTATNSIEQRRAENRAALENVRASALDLNFLDRQYAPLQKRNIEEIADAVEENIESDSSRILATLGLGTYLRRHPDHTTTRRVGQELLHRGYEVSFYVDIPYALPIRHFNLWPERLDTQRITHMLGSRATLEMIGLTPEQQQQKQHAVHAFASQFDMVNRLSLGALKQPDAYRYEAIVHATG